LLAWLGDTADHDLHLAAVTIGELQAGIEMTRDQDPAKADQIESWLEQVVHTYQIVPMDASACRIWAKLMHHKSDALILDAMIAATAMAHNLTVVTRNIGDFKVFRSKVFDPFERK
jgi:predicted nucleic acid-binding protein